MNKMLKLRKIQGRFLQLLAGTIACLAPANAQEKISFTWECQAGVEKMIHVAVNQYNTPYEVDWGDGNKISQVGVAAESKHTYLNGGLVTVNVNTTDQNSHFETIDLSGFDSQGSGVKSLNISQATKLKALYCNNNQLTELDLRNNLILSNLRCGENSLKELDVSRNTALEYLYCAGNQLTTLDVSKNVNIWWKIDCADNQLTTLNVKNNTLIKALDCSGNQLTTLDISHNQQLTDLRCHNNRLTNLDISKNKELTRIHCYENELTLFDLYNISKQMLNGLGEKLLGNQNMQPVQVTVGTPLEIVDPTGKNATNCIIIQNHQQADQASFQIVDGFLTFLQPGHYNVEMTHNEIISDEKFPAKIIAPCIVNAY